MKLLLAGCILLASAVVLTSADGAHGHHGHHDHHDHHEHHDSHHDHTKSHKAAVVAKKPTTNFKSPKAQPQKGAGLRQTRQSVVPKPPSQAVPFRQPKVPNSLRKHLRRYNPFIALKNIQQRQRHQRQINVGNKPINVGNKPNNLGNKPINVGNAAAVRQQRQVPAPPSPVVRPSPSVRGPPSSPIRQQNPRFRRLVSNFRQSFKNFRNNVNSVAPNLRQLPNPATLFRGSVVSPVLQAQASRRNTNLPEVFFKKAEDIKGYEKFTLDEVVYPEKNLANEVLNRSDDENEDDLVFVDDVNEAIEPRKNTKEVEADEEVKDDDTVEGKNKPTDFELR